MKARRLKDLADVINEQYPDLVARVEPSSCNTDRLVGRLRKPGRGRKGNRLVVRWRHLPPLDPEGLVLNHNSAETYRRNAEVERWLEDVAPLLKKPRKNT